MGKKLNRAMVVQANAEQVVDSKFVASTDPKRFRRTLRNTVIRMLKQHIADADGVDKSDFDWNDDDWREEADGIIESGDGYSASIYAGKGFIQVLFL